MRKGFLIILLMVLCFGGYSSEGYAGLWDTFTGTEEEVLEGAENPKNGDVDFLTNRSSEYGGVLNDSSGNALQSFGEMLGIDTSLVSPNVVIADVAFPRPADMATGKAFGNQLGVDPLSFFPFVFESPPPQVCSQTPPVETGATVEYIGPDPGKPDDNEPVHKWFMDTVCYPGCDCMPREIQPPSGPVRGEERKNEERKTTAVIAKKFVGEKKKPVEGILTQNPALEDKRLVEVKKYKNTLLKEAAAIAAVIAAREAARALARQTSSELRVPGVRDIIASEGITSAIVTAGSNPDALTWPKTISLGQVSIKNGLICFPYTKSSGFTAINTFGQNANIGNVWLFQARNTELYTGTWEWLRPRVDGNIHMGPLDGAPRVTDNTGQDCKAYPASISGAGHLEAPMRLKSGEEYCLMVSTHARMGYTSTNERSNLSCFIAE